MSYTEVLTHYSIGISASESADMAALGLSNAHLRDATAEIARYMLALGARLVYGGDLRQHGFSELLFELAARYRRDADDGDSRTSVVSFLPWPVHISLSPSEIENTAGDLAGLAELVCLTLDGQMLSTTERRALRTHRPSEKEWLDGLTAMRRAIVSACNARIVLGGQIQHYKGRMPGIAEEVLLTLQAKQPLYLMGGFGGCTRDICETLGLIDLRQERGRKWKQRKAFRAFSAADLNNGLTPGENAILARTPHVDQAIALTVGGLMRAAQPTTSRSG